jgi:hypothetical protein
MRPTARTVYTKTQNNYHFTVFVKGMRHLKMKQVVSQNRRRISTRPREVTAKETFAILVTAMRTSADLPEYEIFV